MNNFRHKAVIETHPDVMMDDCHIDLIGALVLAAKPKRILEIGIGTGALTVEILRAIELNGCGTLACVDGFNDWYFKRPPGFENLEDRIEFIQSDEREFVKGCYTSFDFIVSDGDHANAGEWFEDTLRLVSDGGFLIYHDADSIHCPSISGIRQRAREMKLSTMMFNKSSHAHERCHRGLLVIQK